MTAEQSSTCGQGLAVDVQVLGTFPVPRLFMTNGNLTVKRDDGIHIILNNAWIYQNLTLEVNPLENVGSDIFQFVFDKRPGMSRSEFCCTQMYTFTKCSTRLLTDKYS